MTDRPPVRPLTAQDCETVRDLAVANRMFAAHQLGGIDEALGGAGRGWVAVGAPS